jgi:hypothetical protein
MSNNDLATFEISHPHNGQSKTIPAKAIQLQSIGFVPAVEAADLKVGDITVWNFGATEEILEVLEPTKAFVKLIIKTVSSGSIHERKLKKTRLVGIKK